MPTVTDNLPPVRVILRGKYWDSQIYSGGLKLFGLDGSILTLNWDKFVANLPLEEELKLVAEAALLGSDRFYTPDMRRLIQDPEIKPIMVEKFRRLQEASTRWTFDPLSLGRRIDNPLPFPHNDSEYYYGFLYVGARSGVFQLVGDQENNRSRSSKQLADIPAFDIATKFQTIAVAAGNDGLVELKLSPDRTPSVSQIAPNGCSTCEWSYASLVCSDHAHSLFVAAFVRVLEERRSGDPRRGRQPVRRFERVITDKDLFQKNGPRLPGDTIQWGAKDKIYRYRDGEVDSVRNSSNGHVSFEPLDRRTISAPFKLDQFVAVRVAPFGSVLEFDDGVAVLLNSGEMMAFPGEPVNWRVYPRSLNYLNHLHIIYEDRIEIIAFTSDYFVPPGERYFGTEPISADDRFR